MPLLFIKLVHVEKKDKSKAGKCRSSGEERNETMEKVFSSIPAILESNILYFHPQGTNETRHEEKRE